MKNSEKFDIESEAIERSMAEFLKGDPVPELDPFELSIMTEKIVSETTAKKRRWFELKPAFQVGLAIVSVIVFIFALNVRTKTIKVFERGEIHFSGENISEKTIIEAVEKGAIAETEVLVRLFDIEKSEKDLLKRIYARDIDEFIDKLSDEDVENIMEHLDKLGYPRSKEA